MDGFYAALILAGIGLYSVIIVSAIQNNYKKIMAKLEEMSK